MTRKFFCLFAAFVVALTLHATAASSAPAYRLSGAIFTTDASGVPVNLNHYAAKQDVYLNGGPGINAPAGAAGLPEGTYSYQVTDPSGKVLLSSDNVSCRQVTVDASGVFRSVAPSGACAHLTGTNGVDGGITVQLYPYDDTPNPGGVYKVWLTPTSALNCGAAGNKHCFVPRYSKTDNFKVKATTVVEIDTRFHKNGALVDGLAAHWTDTLGASNIKYSEYNPAVLAFHEAHVEAAEEGTHKIRVYDQPGCTIAQVTTPTGQTLLPNGNNAVTVTVVVASPDSADKTYFVDVDCR